MAQIMKEKVFLGIISHDRRFDMEVTEGIMDWLLRAPETYGGRKYGVQGGQARARNLVVKAFLASDADSLLFVDVDMGWRWFHLEHLLSCPHGIACGSYSHKTANYRWNHNLLPGTTTDSMDEYGFTEVQEAGTGFMLIRRRVFEDMIAKGLVPYPKQDGADGERIYKFFKDCEMDDRDMSEDWWFCNIAAQAGYRPWIDRKFIIPHVGHALWPLQFCYPELGLLNVQPETALQS